ncbi:MAG: Fur family transcriptional regulator [Frankiales bacterium]|jgi:Fur family ferric uptake transcriptional regulator|nr:Fur family transcriptional regulator [Frankiales bacterium]MCW2585533.1 Fur family transcriptional regulator [Frankiales bacterium]
MRPTRQRTAVAEALAKLAGFTSAQALHDALRHEGTAVGLTTVYRHLQALADAGEVDVLRTVDGESVYRRCADEEHHHHLVCRGCGATVEVTGPAVEAWATAVASEHGYSDVSHTLEVFGTCRACAS